MLKLNTSYSKKVPVPGQEFSSQSYHAAVELELSDALKPEEVQARIHQTFDMVRHAVEAEINGKTAPQPAAQPAATAPRTGKPAEKASNRQIKYILDLAGEKKLPLSQLNADVQRQFNVQDIYALDKKQASQLVDLLKLRQAA
jgi:hypothetical protein